MKSLSDILNSFRGKEVSVTLTSGKEFTGTLSEVLTDALVINTKDGQAVVAVGHMASILEKGPTKPARITNKPHGM